MEHNKANMENIMSINKPRFPRYKTPKFQKIRDSKIKPKLEKIKA